jgi:hypothetical protein
MGWGRYRNAKVKGDTITIDRGNNLAITLVLSGAGKSLSFEHSLSNGSPLKGTLSRAD